LNRIVSPHNKQKSCEKIALYAPSEKSSVSITARGSISSQNKLYFNKCASIANSPEKRGDGTLSKLSFHENANETVVQPSKNIDVAKITNMLLLKKTGKMIKQVALKKTQLGGENKNIANKMVLKNVCSCTCLNGENNIMNSGRSVQNNENEDEFYLEDKMGSVELKPMKDTKMFRKIFTPQNEFAGSPKKTQKLELPVKRRSVHGISVMGRDLKTHIKCPPTSIDNYSGSTASGKTRVENSQKITPADSTKTQLDTLKNRIKTICIRFKKREDLLMKENKKLKAENIEMRKKLMSFLQV